jgi:uncharacterized membrane protein YagU involved in acid resistance
MDSALLRSGAVAGLVAGVVFLIVEMALVLTVGGGELWGPPRMMGAIALGEDVLPPPATFDAGIVAVGMIVHFALSAVLGVIFAFAAGALKLSRGMMILAGAVFGLIVYVVNFYGFTELFPWFAMARNAITIFAHLVFGGVIGWMLGGRMAGPVSA